MKRYSAVLIFLIFGLVSNLSLGTVIDMQEQERELGNEKSKEVTIFDGDPPIRKPGRQGETDPKVKRETKGGVQIFTDLGGKRTIEIREDRKTGISVVIKTTYRPQQHRDLTDRFPILKDYIDLFPRSIEGHEIEMDLTLTSRHSARTLSELKEKHPTAFQLYRRYYKKPTTQQR